MNNQQILSRITTDRKTLSGQPIIRGYPITVEQVLGQLAAGKTYETLREEYPILEPEDIQACLLYAQDLVKHARPGLRVEELASAIPEILIQAPYLILLVLFGSRARGDANSESDWDFAFLCDEEERQKYEKGDWDSLRIWTILQETYNLFDDQIDIIEMKNCSEILAHAISEDGIIIYERNPGIFEAFRSQKLKTPQELRQFRRTIRDNTLQKLQELKK